MNKSGVNSTVSIQEAEALKEMIFKRARERAQSFTDELQTNYTSTIQNDIMDLARESFNATKNPFAKKTEETKVLPDNNDENKIVDIGFSKRKINEIKNKIESDYSSKKKILELNEIESVMENTNICIAKNPTFIGALNFLNSQASIALIKNKGIFFEAMA